MKHHAASLQQLSYLFNKRSVIILSSKVQYVYSILLFLFLVRFLLFVIIYDATIIYSW